MSLLLFVFLSKTTQPNPELMHAASFTQQLGSGDFVSVFFGARIIDKLSLPAGIFMFSGDLDSRPLTSKA